MRAGWLAGWLAGGLAGGRNKLCKISHTSGRHTFVPPAAYKDASKIELYQRPNCVRLQAQEMERENCNIPGGHVFQQTFHEDWTINVISRALTRKTAPPPVSHVFQRTGTIFKFSRAIIRTNLRTKFHEDWTINVISRVKLPRPLVAMFFNGPEPFSNSAEISYILTKFHEHWTTNVTPRVKMTPPPLAAMLFLPIRTIFKLNRCIQEANVLTKFHKDWTKHVTSRVLTCFHYIHIEKTAPPPGGHFHEDTSTIVTSRVFTSKTAPPSGGHLHKDWASNVTFTVFTSFELGRGILGTNVLTKFHEDRTRNVASRVFTRQNVDDARRTDDEQKAIPKAHHEHVVLR
ncbi:hypothetical protein DPMN_027358 [Dreissena polymorpha]|uniref:Uncharacterized protein n=1 Tax=Dreissena polymorpha TaxID=45954 RepID=A0A9D4LWV1_DREPO|nr:hypothetical protein DPMN_027358 [Dreissena polymorpha]